MKHDALTSGWWWSRRGEKRGVRGMLTMLVVVACLAHVPARGLQLSSISPVYGPVAGGIDVALTGSGFTTHPFGTGRDGSLVVTGAVNLNTSITSSVRSYPDAPAYQVIALGPDKAVVSPGSMMDALAPGDEVLLINLQGSTASNANVGNHEHLHVASIVSNLVHFTTPKSRYYGAIPSSDAGVGTNTADQKVMLQRVPNYREVTIQPGATLSASSWNGSWGGVLAFRVNGKLENNGTITMAGRGYRGGAGGANGCSNYPWPTTAGDRGESYAGLNSLTACERRASVLGNAVAVPKNFGGGGGGGGGTVNPHRNGGGGAGASHGGAGGNGGNSSTGERGGTAGDVYGDAAMSSLFLGSGGGGGGRGVNAGGGTGGTGGGMILVYATDIITTSGFLSVRGGNGGNAVLNSDDGAGGGGGGAGGSLMLQVRTAQLGTTNVSFAGGARGTSATGKAYGSGGQAGVGGSGRGVFKYEQEFSGQTEPVSEPLQSSAGTWVLFDGVPSPFISWISTNELIVNVPPHAAGTVDVSLVEGGIVQNTLTNGFVYRDFAYPTLLSVFPSQGPTVGGTWATLSGVHIGKGVKWSTDSQPIVSDVYAGGTATNVWVNGALYRVRTFTNSGTFTASSDDNIEALVVAGGGQGGRNGGGGGGGVVYTSSYAVTAQNYSVVVGAGGNAYANEQGQNGGNSSFGNLVATGGGGGAGRDYGGAGLAGGSGGGGGGSYGGSGRLYPGSGVAGQGKDGGYGYPGACDASGGGGGGAGTIGANAAYYSGGNGGDGLALTISGTTIFYGGGGGGSTVCGGGTQGTGGRGGGGNGLASPGIPNTGGGGGGGGYSGGSGVVVLRYAIFPLVTRVLVDGVETLYEVINANTIRVLMPPHAAGAVSVSVEHEDGASYNLPGAFTYYEPVPPTVSGRVTSRFSGAGLDGVSVAFDGMVTVTTSNGGYYAYAQPFGWSGVVSVSQGATRFGPSSYTFSNLVASTNVYFEAFVDDVADRGDLEYFAQILPGNSSLSYHDIATRYATIPVEFQNIPGGTNVTSSWNVGSDTNDERMLMVRVEGDLTIGNGVTVTPAARKRGMVMYVEGDLNLNGKISMTARGAANVPGDRILVVNANTGEAFEIPANGGAGGAAVSGDNKWGSAGGSGSGGMSGGGGAGGANNGTGSGSYPTSGAGAFGTSYSGGSGGGGAGANYSGTSGSASANGGSGGSGWNEGGGGAGNPMGSGGSGGSMGTGGLLILFVQGDIIISGSGMIDANGSQGNNYVSAGGSGGGGSGGGSVNLFVQGLYLNANSTNITAAGGIGGLGEGTLRGGTGGAGTVRIQTYQTLSARTIRGRAVYGTTGLPAGGMTLCVSPGALVSTVTTDTNGLYTVTVPLGWTGTVSVCATGPATPPVRTYSNLQSDMTGQDFSWTPPLWMNSASTNRLLITVSNTFTNALTDFQVEVAVPYRAGMQTNFADLMVGGMDGVPLPFWVERYRTMTDAVVWVKLPVIPAQATTNFYVYYGSPNTVSAGNGNNVFLFFDDFEDGAIDPIKWPEIRSPQYFSETNGMLRVTGVKGSTILLSTRQMPEMVPPISLEVRSKTVSPPVNGWSPAILYGGGGNNGLSVLESVPSNHHAGVNGSFSGPYTLKPLAEFHRNSMIRKSTTTHDIRSQFDVTTNASWSVSGTHSAYTSMVVTIGPRGDFYDYGSVQAMEGYVDSIWIRSYSPSNVVASIAPAAESLTNVFPLVTISGRVIDQKTGAGLVGLTVTSSLGSVTTTNGGYYTIRGPATWSGTVAVRSDGPVSPTVRTYTNIVTDQSAQNFSIGSPMWLNTAWDYRQLMVVTNPFSGTLTNFQVAVQVPYDNRMRADFGDVRFGTLDGAAVPFWMEDIQAAQTAKAWVKLPLLPAGSVTAFYLYYGNAAATNGSDGDATFDFFDGFDGSAIDSTKWVPELSNYTLQNSVLRINVGNMRTPNLPFNISSGYTLEARMLYHGVSAGYSGTLTAMGPGLYTQGSNAGADATVLWMREVNSRNMYLWIGNGGAATYNIVNYQNIFTTQDDMWYLFGQTYRPQGLIVWRDYASLLNYWFGWSKQPVRITIGMGDCQDTSYDWVRVRKFAGFDPVVAFEATVETRTNLFQSVTVSGRVVNQGTGQGVDGLSVVAGATTAVTTNGGSYTLSLPAGWSGSVTVPGTSFSVSPAARAFTNLQANQAGQDFQYLVPAWFDAAWPSRQLLVITNGHGGALTNFQVELRVPYAAGMKPDFSDLRIADTNGQALAFWIERTRSATDAVVWVKAPYLPALDSVRIYAYYGNATATRGDNGNNVFLFFDDFEDGVIDPVKWPFQRTMNSSFASTPQITETNGHLRMTGVKYSFFQIFSGVLPSSIFPCAVECRTRTPSAPAAGWSPVYVYDNATSVNGVSFLDYTASYQYSCINGAFTGPMTGKPIEEYHRASVILSVSNVFEVRSVFENTSSANWTNRGTYTTYSQPTIGIGPRADTHNPSSMNSMEGLVDAIWMRQHVSAAINGSTVGSPESLATVFPPVTISGRVTGQDTGRGVDALRVNAGAAEGWTTNGGYYQLTLPGNWSGSVTIEGNGSANPAGRTYANLSNVRTNQNFTWTPAAWLDLTWLYRRTVTVTNSMSTLTNFQVGVTLPYTVGMQTNFADVRVVGPDGTAWSFWVEQYGPTTSATVWVKVPVLAGYTTTSFDLYYGNANAASMGDGDATFEFFDDFNSPLSSSKWPNIRAGTATTNGNLVLDAGEGLMATNYIIAPNTIWESRALTAGGIKSTTLRAATTPASGYVADGGANIVDILVWTGWYFGEWNGGEYQMGPTFPGFVISRILYLPGFVSNRVHYAVTDGKLTYSYGTHNSHSVQTNLSPLFYSTDGQTLVDWYRIRKNATTMPVVNLGAEQRQEDLFTQMYISGRVVDTTGAGVDGAVVAISGVNPAVTTNGGYFTGNATIGWSGTVEPSHPLYTFTPLSRGYGSQTGSVSGITFTGSRQSPVLSGRVTNIVTGVGVDGVTLNFSAGAGSVVTDAGGNYSHAVPYGWAGSVTLTYTNGTFDPSPRSYADGSANPVLPWMDAAWSSRALLTVSNANAGALSQHQVGINLPWMAGMQSDFRDIRFTDWAGNRLAFWIQSLTSGVSARVWVKVPAVGAQASTNLYLYYGNAVAASASNPDATMEFYDGFDGASLDTNKWEKASAELADNEISVSGGILNLNGSGTPLEYLRTKSYVATPPVVLTTVQRDYTAVTYPCDFGFGYRRGEQGTSEAVLKEVYTADAFSVFTQSGSVQNWGSQISADNAYHLWDLLWSATRAELWRDGVSLGFIASAVPSTALPVTLGHPGVAAPSTWQGSFDSIFVRKYAAVEPAVAISPAVQIGSTMTDQHYSWTPGPVTVSGRVRHEGSGEGVMGVVVKSSLGGAVTSGVDGAYSVSLPYNASVTLVPTNGSTLFAPMLRTYDGIRGDRVDQDFFRSGDQFQVPTFLHQGDNHPVNVEGWTLAGSTSLPNGSWVTNGVSAWLVNDNTSGNYLEYRVTPSAGQTSQASSQGWSLKANMLVINTNDALDSGINVSYCDGTRAYYLGFGTTTNRDPIVGLWTGTWSMQYTNVGGAGQYHVYELRYLPGAGVTFLVNGQPVFSNFTGVADTTRFIRWGSASSGSLGNSAFQHVSWSIGQQVSTVSGRVTDELTGSGVDGVTMQFSGWGGSTLTTNGGYYTRTLATNWSGTLTPVLANKAMVPASRIYDGLPTNMPNQNFVVAGPRQIYVSQTGLANAPYTNWNDAARDIPSAIAAAVPGDTIRVNDGTYGVTTVISVSKAITIRSENGPEWTTIRRTSGRTGIINLNGVGVVLDGFTIRDGYRDWYTGPTGTWCEDPAPGTAGGAGVFNGAEIRNCIIRNNHTIGFVTGGGLYLDNGSKAINCLVFDNSAQGTICGMFSEAVGGVRIENNSALINCVVYGNSGGNFGGNGGVFQHDGGLVYIDNSIIYGNSGANPYWHQAYDTVRGVAAADLYAMGTMRVRNSIYGSAGSIVNINSRSVNPGFVDTGARNFRLRADSWALNGGLEAYNQLAEDIVFNARVVNGIDIGAYETQSNVVRVVGRVTNEYVGGGVSGVTVTFSNGGGSTTTDSAGYYLRVLPYNWSGTVTPTYSAGSFPVPSLSYSSLTGEMREQNFNWIPPMPVIAGRVTHRYLGEGVDGVTISLSNGGGSTLTTNGGFYTIAVPGYYTGTATVVYDRGSFLPATRGYTNVVTDKSAQNYQWEPPTYVMSGRILRFYEGTGLDGVSVSLSNGGGSTTTTNGGYYSLPVFERWSGRVTPNFGGSGSFTPANFRDYGRVSNTVSQQDYEWVAPNPVVSGRVTLEATGEGVDGAVVQFSGGVSSATTAGGGYYARAVPYDWTGTATPAHAAGGAFLPSATSFTGLKTNAGYQDFVWSSPMYVVSGTVLDTAAGAPKSGVTLVVGGWSNTVSAGDGRYAVEVYHGWSGTIRPAFDSGRFATPTQRTYSAVSGVVANQDYTWLAPRVISGRVTNESNGAGVAGVIVTASGGLTTVTDAGGWYEFTLYHTWSGSVAPSNSGGGVFSAPSSRSYGSLTADMTAQNFNWRPHRTISGRIVNETSGAGLAGATLVVPGVSNVTTVSGGAYSVTVPYQWSGVITPAYASGVFVPTNRAYNQLAGNIANEDYVWRAPNAYTLSGRVINQITGLGVSNIAIISSAATNLRTGADGAYAIVVPEGWSGSIAPSNNAGSFAAPTVRSFTALAGDQSGLDFTWIPPAPLVSGRVVHHYTGAGVAGVTIAFAGTTGTVLTGGSGYYTSAVPYGWSGAITPSFGMGTFTPASLAVGAINSNSVVTNLVWLPPMVTIGGAVTNMDSGAGVAGVDFAVSGLASGISLQDGSYTLQVYYGWSGTVTLSMAGATFAPATRVYQNVTNALSGQLYSLRPDRAVQGRVIDGLSSQGVAGVTVNASNVTSSTTASDGSYLLMIPHGWTGRIAPTNSSMLFAPAFRQITAITSALTGVDFVRESTRAISGRVTDIYTGAGIDNISITLSGAASAMTATGGYYRILVTYGYSGTATVTAAQGTIAAPSYRVYQQMTEDAGGQDYAWIPPNPLVGGRVTNQWTGAGVAGVAVQWSNGGGSALTDAAGYFSNAVARGWSGMVSLSATGGTITGVASQEVMNVTSNRLDLSFNFLPYPTISGRVTNQATAAGVSGATINFSNGGGSTTTDGAGRYAWKVPTGWSGSVSATAAGGVISPATHVFANLSANVSNVNFNLQPPMPVISGRVYNVVTEAGHPGITIQLTPGGSTVTDANGQYAIAVSNNWSGTLVPQVSGIGTCAPASRALSGVVNDRNGQDFNVYPAPVTGDRYVAASGSDTYPYTNWAMAARSLHVALNAANRGETIWVTNGVYNLTRTLVVDKPVKIKGLHGAATTVLRRGTNAAMRLVELRHSNADLSGFTLREGWLSSGAGAGLYIQRGYAYNCIIRENTNTAGQAAGVYLGDANLARIANSLLIQNMLSGGSGSAAIQGQGTVVNCTVDGNTPAGLQASYVYNTLSDGAINATEALYSIAPNLHAGAGNQTSTPLYADAGAGNYQLQAGSPGVDDGRNYYNTLPRDLDEQARIIGNIDMGAYELLPAQGLSISVGADPNPVAAGQGVALYLQAWNGGPNMASGVEVHLDLAGALGYISNSVGAAYHAASGVWTLGDMPAQSARLLTLWFTADAAGAATNIAWIDAASFDPSPDSQRWATNVLTILGDVLITNVAASTSSGNSTVEWSSVVGMGYSVHSFDGAYTDAPNWTERGTMLASEEVRVYLDQQAGSVSGNARFYQVTYTGDTPDTNHVWGFIRVPVRAGDYTLIAPPLTCDRRFDGQMGAALAERLTGHDGGVGDRVGDEVYILQPNGTWRILYVDAQKVWRESNGSSSAYELPAGSGFFVARHSSTSATVTFTGEVGNYGTNRVTLASGWNLVSISEGKNLPLASAFEAANPVGGAREEDADLVVVQTATGAWRRFMRVQGWGAPYDGKWFDLSTFQVTTLQLTPGQAYYYYRQPGGGTSQLSF